MSQPDTRKPIGHHKHVCSLICIPTCLTIWGFVGVHTDNADSDDCDDDDIVPDPRLTLLMTSRHCVVGNVCLAVIIAASRISARRWLETRMAHNGMRTRTSLGETFFVKSRTVGASSASSNSRDANIEAPWHRKGFRRSRPPRTSSRHGANLEATDNVVSCFSW